MPEDLDPNQPTPPGGQPAVEPQVAAPQVQPQQRVIDPERYDALEALASQLSPYAEDIQRFVADEDARKIAKSSWNTWDQNRKVAEPENPLEKKVDKLVDYVSGLESQTKKQAAISHINALAAEHPFLKENGWAAVGELEREATGLGITEPMAQARYIERVVARIPKTTSREEPPTSLRADAATPGVPGRTADKPANPQDIREWLIKSARRAQGA